MFLDPQTLVLSTEISKKSEHQWVDKLILTIMIYWTALPILRMIPCYMMIGSTNTEQQSITKACLEWVDHFLPVSRWLISPTKVSRLMTTDLKAINYIVFNAYDYQKPELIAFAFRQMFGSGMYSQWTFFDWWSFCTKGFYLWREMPISIRYAYF